MSFLRRTAPASACFFLLADATYAHAQTPPVACSVRQQIEQQQHPPLPPEGPQQFAPPPPLKSIGGTTITVHQFAFADNTLLSNSDLSGVVAPNLNQPHENNKQQKTTNTNTTTKHRAKRKVRVY